MQIKCSKIFILVDKCYELYLELELKLFGIKVRYSISFHLIRELFGISTSAFFPDT